ncbi:MAG: 2-trimethylaminoethylphosphonate dioxygenase [Candidatus Puniceispirillaceae bacterium]
MFESTLSDDGKCLTLIDRAAGTSARFHAIWLRDNAWDETTRSPENGQRLITLRDIPADLAITGANINEAGLEVTFSNDSTPITYDLRWLMDNRYDRMGAASDRGWVPDEVTCWDSAFTSAFPTARFDDLQHDVRTLRDWLGKLVKYGFAHMSGGPIEDGALMRVVDLFGYVRETNYGRQFEVRTEINPINLAYTGQGLQAHTDNPYRDPMPTMQILYCLECTAAGGDNMVVDGFAAARRLREENVAWFDVLADHCARFEYVGGGNTILTARRPMIELAPDGELIGVRFNNRSAAALTDIPFEAMQTYYDAYRRFGEIIDDPAMEMSFRLKPGECFVVSNTRVLHARKAYGGTGNRWLQGCYADRDSLISRHRILSELADAG